MPPRGTVTISTLLADDEQLALDELAFHLGQFPEIEVIGTARNGLQAVDLIQDLEPDLVFLDVQMPGLDGIGVIRRLQELGGPLPYFILATAYDQYAVEAFQLEALDYLLKPVDHERLAVSIARAQRYVQDKQRAIEPATSETPAGAARPALQRTKVLVKSGARNLIVDARDIVYATIDDGLITVVTTTVEGMSNYRTIEELQSNLDPESFWRVHRSYLVNINRIKEVVPWFKSSFQLKMDDKKGSEIPVSRVQTKRLRALLKL
ncbi:MAG: response regulator transcription factor [Acidobacteriia bacterium]|nr:response regulator transcription factor [Terriglobia bacterium]